MLVGGETNAFRYDKYFSMLKKTDRLNNQANLTQRFERRFFLLQMEKCDTQNVNLIFLFFTFSTNGLSF